MPRLKRRDAEKMTTGGHVDVKILPGAVLLKANSAALGWLKTLILESLTFILFLFLF
jgi:hypothetical protein